jgi:hypothetical protein
MSRRRVVSVRIAPDDAMPLRLTPACLKAVTTKPEQSNTRVPEGKGPTLLPRMSVSVPPGQGTSPKRYGLTAA